MLLKILLLLLLPTGSALCLLLLALAFVLRRQRRRALAASLLALGWLWLWATPIVADEATVILESRHPVMAAAALPTADAILLLGGDRRGGKLRMRDSDPARYSRVAFAAALYAAGRAPVIVATGAGDRAARYGTTEADIMHTQLTTAGVPASAIVLERSARNTRENMAAATPLLHARGATRILLVTSALHMPRAMANARALGIEVVAAPADRDPAVGRFDGWRAVLPQFPALMRSQRAIKEYLGLAHQRIWGVGSP
ncbi:MAG: YdcF family protein [Pseudomonadota bacterium]|nr:YdcF family protein [Pseudomonadota bacterium]